MRAWALSWWQLPPLDCCWLLGMSLASELVRALSVFRRWRQAHCSIQRSGCVNRATWARWMGFSVALSFLVHWASPIGLARLGWRSLKGRKRSVLTRWGGGSFGRAKKNRSSIMWPATAPNNNAFSCSKQSEFLRIQSSPLFVLRTINRLQITRPN